MLLGGPFPHFLLSSGRSQHANIVEWNLRVLVGPCVSSSWNLHTALSAYEARAGECYLRET